MDIPPDVCSAKTKKAARCDFDISTSTIGIFLYGMKDDPGHERQLDSAYSEVPKSSPSVGQMLFGGGDWLKPFSGNP